MSARGGTCPPVNSACRCCCCCTRPAISGVTNSGGKARVGGHTRFSISMPRLGSGGRSRLGGGPAPSSRVGVLDELAGGPTGGCEGDGGSGKPGARSGPPGLREPRAEPAASSAVTTEGLTPTSNGTTSDGPTAVSDPASLDALPVEVGWAWRAASLREARMEGCRRGGESRDACSSARR